MTPCIGSGSCEKSIPPVSGKWKSRRETRGRATTSSTQHLLQFSVPKWDFETTSACFRLTFSWRESAWCMIENIFPHLTTRKSKRDFFTHGTSNFRQKLEIDWSFQLVSYLGFIVLWASTWTWTWVFSMFVFMRLPSLSLHEGTRQCGHEIICCWRVSRKFK